MRLDSLVRLIEAADFMSFRQLALLYLDVAGYEGVELRDGPGDGGNDVTLWRLGANPSPVAVQLSVQKTGWERKIRQDAAQAADAFSFTQFLYVTSRRIPAVEANGVMDDLWSRQGVALRIIDSQSIATKMYVEGRASDVLATLDIRVRGRDEQRNRKGSSLRQELAYAYAFFGTDVHSFREAAIERSLLAYVTRAERPLRATAVDEVSKILGLSRGRSRLVDAQVDRMLQRGDLLVSQGTLTAPDHLADAHRAARALRAEQWSQLEKAIGAVLGEAGLRGRSLERSTSAAVEAAGALMLNAAAAANAAIASGGDTVPARARIRAQLRRLERSFVEGGVDPGAAAPLMTDVAQIVSASDLGQNLLAGDLFLSLLALETPDLLSALGDREHVQVFLDASVAIPMLASLLYEPHDEHFFRAAAYAYEAARKHGIDLFLPKDYLEEAASHLLDAYDHYRPLLAAGAELRYSKNAFVAHFAALRAEAKIAVDFSAYARSFGLGVTEHGARHRVTERDWIMGRMQTLFGRYGISVEEHGQVPGQALRAAQEAITFTARELQLDRARRLLEHDIRAVADISARSATGSASVMFCTWDRLHLRLRTAGGSVEWNALDPVMLGDLLALVTPDDDTAMGAAVDVALELGEEDARRGAEIWDELVRIEQDSFYDADLLAKAQAFKASYMARARLNEEHEPLAKAWASWKSRAHT